MAIKISLRTTVLLVTCAAAATAFSVHLWRIYERSRPVRDLPAHPPTVAVQWLTSLRLLQEDIRRMASSDADHDGLGEFGDDQAIENADRIWTARRSGKNEWRLHEQSGYTVRLYLPHDTDAREKYWCAVAWPSDDRYARAFVVFEGCRGVVYEAPWQTLRAPTLEDVFQGAPYYSPIRATWRPNRVFPPDHESVRGSAAAAK